MRSRGKVVGALCAVLVVTAMTPFRATPAAADDPLTVSDGLSVSSRSVYVVDPSAHAVHVSIDTTITNTSPPRGNSYSYFDTFKLPVLPEAANLAATRDEGVALSVTSAPTELAFLSIATIDLQPNLLYGQTQVLHLTYDLPAVPPRSPSISRNNDAYVSFAIFPIADPGQADVVVQVPDRFTVETVGADLDKTSDAATGTDTYSAIAIPDPLRLDVIVAASDETKLSARDVGLADRTFTLHAWPDDASWSDFVAAEVTKAVPVLEQDVGLPMPGVADIDVYETATPYLYGYAGWYDRKESRVDIGDELDADVVVHEISHAWFNDTLVNSRWVDEGLAQEYAAEVLAATGDTPTAITAPDPASPGALRLSAWENPDLTSPLSQEQEQYGYDAAYAVVHAIAAEIGPEKMRAVLSALDQHTVVYGSGDSTEKVGEHGWHQFLDVVDEVGGAAGADQVVRDLVATPDDIADLDARDTARASYKAFVAGLDGWTAPLAVRQALSRWSFELIDALIARSQAARTSAAAVAAAVQPLGIEPTALRDEYQSTDDLDGLEAHIAAASDAATALVAADHAVNGSHDPLATIGLLSAPASSDLDEAKAAFASGHYDEATAKAGAAQRTADDASMRGVETIGAVLVVIGLVVGVVLLVRRRRRRPRPEPPGTTVSPFAPAPPEPVVPLLTGATSAPPDGAGSPFAPEPPAAPPPPPPPPPSIVPLLPPVPAAAAPDPQRDDSEPPAQAP